MASADATTLTWREFDAIRARAVATASGTVLEVGAGTGDNFAHFSSDVTWIGLEPHEKSRAQLERNARGNGHTRGVLRGTAESIPLADSSVDSVVATFVMCSVADVAASLAEFRRVLMPGGQLILVDHVAAPPGTGTRLIQNAISPVSRRIDKGCRWNREITADVAAAGFANISVDEHRLSVLPGLLAVPCAVHTATA